VSADAFATIYAAASAVGGGVAVVRVSGPRAREICEGWCGRLPAARRLERRALPWPDGTAEDALVVQMPGPASYTGEDVVELHVHGGRRGVAAVLAELGRRGARPAGPGEFTRRAFEHGRLDLAQAEGIAAQIGARTDEELRQARRLAAGTVSAQVRAALDELTQLRVAVAATLDFPDDVEVAESARWIESAETLAGRLSAWEREAAVAERARRLARVVVAGPVNAGKSSLVNALVGRDRVVVSPEPGTTRDYVEVVLERGRVALELVDTAGVRAEAGVAEAAGIAAGRREAETADLVLWTEAADAAMQGSAEAPGEEGRIWRVETKRDLGTARAGWLGVSARTGEGIAELWAKLEEFASVAEATLWAGLSRHVVGVRESAAALERARSWLAGGVAPELAERELAQAQARLEEVVGERRFGAVGEELLEAIFGRFCIGK
jgi:tRNA modification GTPase